MFEVSLSNLERNFELQNVKNIFEAPGRKIIVFLSVDGHVSFNIKIANCDKLSGIDSFSWSRDYNHLEECLGFRTYNSKLKCINEWSIQLSEEGGVVNQEGKWLLVEALTNIKEKYNDLPSNPSICILQLNGDPVLLIQDVVVTLKLNSSGAVDITRSFQVKEFSSNESNVADSIVQKDFLFILEESGIISIYSLTQGRHIAVVKLIDYWKLVYPGIGVLSQHCKATHLAISSNLQHLLIYFTGTKFSLHHVYLDDYFQHFPNHIHSIHEVASFIPEEDADEDDFDFHRMSKSTSRGWKSQVERLNSKLQVKGEIKGVGTSPLCNTSHHWFDTSKCNYKDEFNTQLKEKNVKISGFNKKIFQRQTSDRQDNSTRRRHSSSSSQDSDSIPNKDSRHGSFILKIPKACRHSELQKLSAAIETTMLWFKGKGHGMMLLVDLQTNKQQCISFSEPTFVSTPCLDGQSPLLITSDNISAIAVGVDQEYLINKVMTYESATLAERLCQSNNWAHCSIPIHALEVGLKHRQLDTIAFFLKCREGVFSHEVESEQSINTDTEELWDALGLLLASIRENMSESQSKQYSDQLVHLTLTFVNRLIQNTWDTQKALEMDEGMIDRVHEVKATSQKLMRYTCDLRGFLKDSPSWCAGTKSDVLPQTDEDKEFKGYYWCQDQIECEELNNFKTMTKKDVVESAILESCLPLAQAYLYQTMDQQVVMETNASSNSSSDKHSDNESVTTSNSMNELIQIGRSMVIRSLINGDLNKASRILSNMGFNVKVELKQMCMQTTNRSVRDFLICELQKMGEFNAEEESAIEFIRHFEKLYPKHSFEEATLKSIERQTEHWKEPMAVISISLESGDDDEPPQSSLAVDASLEDHDHTHLPLECVQLWDKKTRERILFERIIQLDSAVPDLIPEEHISMVSAWEFLTSRADWKQIQNWIKASFPLAEDDTALEMPIKHPLETCVANQLELTPDFMKDWILDELATRGVFSSNEIQDFDKLLKRLSRIYRVISLPHPLTMGRMQVDMTDFCNQFVSFCVKRNLCSVLYEFLDNMDLCLTADDVTELDLPIEECPWLHMMLHFRWVGKYLSDPSYMFQTSLACSRVFLSSFQPSVMSLLEADRPLAAMATLMYAPGTLEQAMTGPVCADESLWKVDAKVLENSLKPYRTLHSTLFPNHVDGVPVQDVSVYDLLQAYSPFDVSKLFLWQSTNNVAIREEDQRYEMPQFSDSDLVSKYGHKEDLDFTYYLKQGRPSFAFTSFVEHQIELGGTSKKRISQAQAKACLIALRLFANQGIASACVAFIEMLGRDSTRLRVDLQTANTIYNFQQKEEEWRKQDKQHWQEWLLNAEKKIAGNLLCAFRKHGKRSSELLIRLLESAISNKLVKINNSYSLEAAREWDVAVMFCRFHRLPLTDVYLRDCAKHDEWLCFTVFAQQHQYPKEHVLELVQTFKSTSLTEHLSLAFENPVYGSSFPPTGQHGYTTQSSITKKKSIVRDHRTTYLFKVGFDSGKNGGEEDSTDEDEEADNFDDEYQHMSEHSESQFQDLVLENVPSDLFGVILACQSSPHPAKMLLAYSAIFKQPSLAVLSACFPNSDQLNCLCMFLMTSMKDEDVFIVTGNEIALLQWHQWNLDELMSIVRITMETGKSLILCKAFQVFQPASPLTSYLEFICAYLVKSDEALAAVHLKNFHHKYLEIVENSDNLQEVNTTSATDINNLKFLEKAVSELTLLSFKCCCNFAATCRFLKLMAGLNFSGIFYNPVANYTKLYELSMIIKSTSVQLDIGRLLTGDGSVFHKHCQEVLEKLQAVKDFTSAKKFAIAAGLNMDHVVINQLKDELKKLKNNTQWNSTKVRELFWQKCNKELKSTKTSNKAAFQFFRSIASDVSLNLSTGEKIVILCLALEWLGKVTASTSPTYVGLEQDIWRLRVDLEIEKIKNGNKCHSPVDKVFISKPRSSHDIPGSGVKYRGSEEFLYLADYELIAAQPMKTADIPVALNKIVKELLDSFCIIQAHKVCQQFSYFSQDLAVVLTCIRLARKQLTTEDLSTDMKMLLARGKRKRLSLSESLSSANRTYSFSSLSSVSDMDESDEILTCLETFCEHSNDGAQCCNRITNCYKVSQILNYTYEDIVTQSSIETLKVILQSNTPQQFSIAKEFIQTTCMNDVDVSSFLADMIIKQVTLKAEQQQQGQALDSQVPLSRKPSDKDELTKFIRLCQNPATLGNRLIQEAKALLDNSTTSKIAHTLQVELIIRAHDCHTICCNMEGISSVLRLCRDCTQVLGKAEEHRLMIRLIMGVGRCSEMMYTFEYLHKAKKLEHLIKIGSKDGKLKIALLDYLKRCKPPDPETYNMVSFKFRMHREIGEMLEKDAMKSLKALADRAMETNIELQNCLQEILQGLTEAAQNYAKENCLRHAEHCTCQARLVALQLHLLSTNTRVINLDSNEFHKFITKHGKFHEALLVASAYSDQHVKWSNALYYNVIQQGNFVFLDDFKRSLRLEESHFTDMSSRYKHDQEKTAEMRENMKRLVGYCRDLKTAYDMATELNFQDIAMDMLKGDGGSYLRDII